MPLNILFAYLFSMAQNYKMKQAYSFWAKLNNNYLKKRLIEQTSFKRQTFTKLHNSI